MYGLPLLSFHFRCLGYKLKTFLLQYQFTTLKSCLSHQFAEQYWVIVIILLHKLYSMHINLKRELLQSGFWNPSYLHVLLLFNLHFFLPFSSNRKKSCMFLNMIMQVTIFNIKHILMN